MEELAGEWAPEEFVRSFPSCLPDQRAKDSDGNARVSLAVPSLHPEQMEGVELVVWRGEAGPPTSITKLLPEPGELPPACVGFSLPDTAGTREAAQLLASAVTGCFFPACGWQAGAGDRMRSCSRPTPWISPESRPRRALLWLGEVDGRAQALVVEAIRTNQSPCTRGLPIKLLLCSADSEGALRDSIEDCIRLIADGRWPEPDETPAAYRLAVTAESTEDAIAKLEKAATKIAERSGPFTLRQGVFYGIANASPAPTAFLFPGQGSQYAQMVRDLCLAFPQVRAWYDLLEETFLPMNLRPSRWLYAEEGSPWEEARQKHLESNDGGAPGVMAGSLGVYDLLRHAGVRPATIAGHSSGENAALICAGVYQFDRSVIFRGIHDLVEMSGDPFSGSNRGRALAVSLRDGTDVDELLREYKDQVFLAMDNCPHQVVLFCLGDTLEEVSRRLSQTGSLCFPLSFERPFHTKLFEPALPYIQPIMDRATIGQPEFPVLSCASLEPIEGNDETIKQRAIYQWSHPVRFRELVLKLREQGISCFVEVGPGANLRGFVQDTCRDAPPVALATDQRNGGLQTFLQTLARLYVMGHPVRMPGGPAKTTGTPPTRPARETPAPLPPSKNGNSPADPMRALLEGHLQVMQQALASQETMTRAALGLKPAGLSEAPSAGKGKRLPLLPPGVEPTNGKLGFDVAWTLHDLPFLADHSLGRTASFRRPGLRGIAVLPFTFSMEVAAEAAIALLGPSQVVTGLYESRGYRWLAIDRDALRIRVEAERTTDGAARVRLFEMMPDGRPMLAFETTVRVGGGFKPAPKPLAPLRSSPPEDWSAPNLYRICLFHGPRFQAVKAIRHLEEMQIEADLETPELDGFLPSNEPPQFELSPVLLDCSGQLGAYAVAQRSYYVGLFPFAIKAMEQFAPPPPERTPVICRGHTWFDGERNDMSFDYISEDGNLLFRIEHKEQRCREYPRAFHLTVYWPEAGAFLSDPWAENEFDGIARIVREDVSEFLDTSWGIWSRALAHMTLDLPEREIYYKLPTEDRSIWLCGRNAAKDALREWARRTHQIELFPADIQLFDESGELRIRCPELEEKGSLPHVKIASDANRAIGVVTHERCRIAFTAHATNSETEPDATFSGDEKLVIEPNSHSTS